MILKAACFLSSGVGDDKGSEGGLADVAKGVSCWAAIERFSNPLDDSIVSSWSDVRMGPYRCVSTCTRTDLGYAWNSARSFLS
jgi:hypothetical protein